MHGNGHKRVDFGDQIAFLDEAAGTRQVDQGQSAADASLKDTGGSLFLTYWPSEFSQIRAQYRRTNYAEGTTANELLFQFRFGIGAHAAHVPRGSARSRHVPPSTIEIFPFAARSLRKFHRLRSSKPHLRLALPCALPQ